MGLQLRELRRARGMTQRELAELLGQTDRVLGAWERGESALPLDDAARIADVFEVSLDELAGRDFRPASLYSDPLQAEVNERFEMLNTRGRMRAADSLEDIAANAANLKSGEAADGAEAGRAG